METEQIIEDIETKRKRLIFRAWHRGMREMDLLLGSFADKYVPDFSAQELTLFDDLLRENDPDLYNWISGRESVPANIKNTVTEQLLTHKFKTENP